MTQLLTDLSRVLAESPPGVLAVYLMQGVPGFAPIIQTVHILGVSVVMGSIVLIDLRVLGVALPSQSPTELVDRLMPWLWWALVCLALSGLVSLFARPPRYLLNPVFGFKLAMLAPAIALAVVLKRTRTTDAEFWQRSRWRRVSARVMAACSLFLWMGVAMAGRWIAYADFFFFRG